MEKPKFDLESFLSNKGTVLLFSFIFASRVEPFEDDTEGG